MKIWIDIGHIAQLNFYLQSIKRLSRHNQVSITMINRGVLPKIANYELGMLNNIKIKTIGNHRGNAISIILESNLLRLIKLFIFAIKFRPNLHFSNGFIGPVICKLLGIPAYTFGDDPDKLDFRLKSIFSKKTFYCLDKMVFKNMNVLNTPKEWSYLSPRFFKPNQSVLNSLELKPYSYVFAREVITTTTNYNEQFPDLILTISKDLPDSIPVILSLENKSKRLLYPKHWIILEEPVRDIHSFIYFSKVLISSGDSMAREGSILGVPSIYIGKREMHANNQLIKFGKLYTSSPSDAINLIEKLFNKDINLENRLGYRKFLLEKFIDLTDFICNLSKEQ